MTGFCCVAHEARRKIRRKDFFFEKKKQKTFEIEETGHQLRAHRVNAPNAARPKAARN
jgi:hypothetical protein